MNNEADNTIETRARCECKDCIIRALIFEHIHSDQVFDLCRNKREAFYKKGEVIVSEGMEIHDLIYVREGLVKYYKQVSPIKTQIISISRAYEFTSLLSIFSEKQYIHSIAAIEDTRVCMITLEQLKKMVLENSRFALGLLEKMSKAADNVIQTFTTINQKHLRGRIAFILLHFANEIYKSETYNLPVSRKEIAELIGMTTENVIRIMSEFRKEKIIRINGKQIEITDIPRLNLISTHG